MRTPKHKKMMQKAKNTASSKLRKKAMRNKMVKKTLLEVGGDDTREDVRDLMNESDMSLNGVVGFIFYTKSLISPCAFDHKLPHKQENDVHIVTNKFSGF